MATQREAAHLIEKLGAHAVMVGLDLPDGFDFDAWWKVGAIIGQVKPSNGWWFADWMNFGWAEYGGMYETALSLTRRDYRTLRNLATIGDAFPRPRRRRELKTGHHAAVVSLSTEEQDALLGQAVNASWSVRHLRAAVTTLR